MSQISKRRVCPNSVATCGTKNGLVLQHAQWGSLQSKKTMNPPVCVCVGCVGCGVWGEESVLECACSACGGCWKNEEVGGVMLETFVTEPAHRRREACSQEGGGGGSEKVVSSQRR